MTMRMSLRNLGSVQRLARNIRNFDQKGALEDCATIFENSTKVGYLKHITPGGAPWPKNPEWWQKMKGHSSPLTGVTAGGVSKPSPPWVVKGNREQMKNQLQHKVSQTTATIFYKRSAAERAAINQRGGITDMEVFHFLNPGIKVTWRVNVQAREHLGIATRYKRLGVKTDPEHFEEAFSRKIDKAIGGL